MGFAMEEFYAFLNQLPSPANQDDKRLWYIASLISDLAYHHVPEFELERDHVKRVKVIPSDAFQTLVARGQPAHVGTVLRAMDFPRTFVIEDRGIIAVGIFVSDRLIIGFRGTVSLYDWRINLSAKLTHLDDYRDHHHPWPVRRMGGYHRGFAEEAIRIGVLITEQLQSAQTLPRELILCGHSLGGAVASVCGALIGNWAERCQTITFGAPRFCDAAALYARAGSLLAVKRVGDLVPLVPPRSKGFVDCLKEYDTLGRPVQSALRDTYSSYLAWRWALFVGTKARAHAMESYRGDIGRLVGAQFATSALTAASKIKS